MATQIIEISLAGGLSECVEDSDTLGFKALKERANIAPSRERLLEYDVLHQW
jgi:hypothetical protein